MADPNTPLVQDLKPLNEVKYAARDYPSIFDSLLRRLKIEYSTVYNDYATTSQGIMLIELMAYAMDAVQWYIDRRASDCFLDTARTNAAIARLVKQIGYKMGAAGAASTTLTMTFPQGTTGSFKIPAAWQFNGPDGLLFETYAEYDQPVALSPGAVIQIPVRQGETRTVRYTSDGSKNQQFRLASIPDDRFLGGGTVRMWADSQLWTEKEFLEFEKTNHYEVGYNDAPPIVQCGDGVAGNIPPRSAPVVIKFIIIDGEKGNVKSNSITSSVETLETIDGDTVTFSVTNPNGATGGRNLEDPEQARRLAPFSFAARGAAITKQDYEALSNSYSDPTYGAVAKSYAFNPRQPYEDAEFNRLVSAVENYLNEYLDGDGLIFHVGMKELESDIDDAASSLASNVSGVQNEMLDLETARSEILSNNGAAISGCQSSGSDGASIESYSANATSNCDDAIVALDALIGDINGGVSDSNLVATVDQIKALVELIKTSTITSQSLGGSIRGTMSTAVYDQLYAVKQIVSESAIDPPDYNIPSIISNTEGYASSLSTGVSDLQSQIENIVGEAETLNDLINTKLTLMQERIGFLFNADCISNYVQVPILSLDVDGNYASPSVGLMTGLQAYLDGIKEVTQQVEVTDGGVALVGAELEMVLDVNKDAFVEAEIVSDIVATIVGLLKGRDFNQPLYLSDLYEIVKDVSPGITWVSINIVGPTLTPTVIDTDGNLVTAENQIIAFGSLMISDKSGNVLYAA